MQISLSLSLWNPVETAYVLSRVVENGFPRSALNNTGESFCTLPFSAGVLSILCRNPFVSAAARGNPFGIDAPLAKKTGIQNYDS